MICKILIFISSIVFSVAAPGGSSNKVIDLYYTPGSAPCRAVMLTAKYLGINLNLKPIDLFKDEHKSEAFLKINPRHKIPVLVDGDFTITDSHAIMIYLAKEYGKPDTIYPENSQQQSLMISRMLFDATDLYLSFSNAYYPLMKKGVPYTDDQIKLIDEAFEFLDKFLQTNEYVIGNKITLADFSIMASITTIVAVNYDASAYPNVAEWVERTKSAFLSDDYTEANGKGVEAFRQLYIKSTKAEV